jgi:hypothetical protein
MDNVAVFLCPFRKRDPRIFEGHVTEVAEDWVAGWAWGEIGAPLGFGAVQDEETGGGGDEHAHFGGNLVEVHAADVGDYCTSVRHGAKSN